MRTSEQLTQLMDKLNTLKKTVATAESCTGGLLATLLTDLPGSSEIYKGGVSVYSDFAKNQMLAIPHDLLLENGAVSEQVAKTMARTIKNILRTDYGISLTGIAGPTGGTPEKPVGTVWCGIADRLGAKSFLFKLEGTRDAIRREAASLAVARFLESL